MGNYVIAYLGGLVTLLAPCAAMLLPAFFSYAFSSLGVLARRTAVFYLGLISGLVPVGALAGTIGGFFTRYTSQISFIGGLVIIILGVWQALALPTLHLPSRRRANSDPARKASSVGVFLLGLTYGLAGAGCTGPILGSVLTAAGLSGSSLQGGIMMFFYATGMFTPVVILAFLWDVAKLGEKQWLKPKSVKFLGRYTTVGNLISGAIFIILGAFLAVFGGISLPGILDANGQFALETSLQRFIALVPNWLFIALFLVIAALIAVLVYNRYQGAAQTRRSPGE